MADTTAPEPRPQNTPRQPAPAPAPTPDTRGQRVMNDILGR